MSETRIPITDAFSATDHLESLEVELTTEQIEWLQEKAEERGLSLDHMLRTVITAQMRAQDNGPATAASAAPSGDGMDESAPEPAPPTETTPDTNEADDDKPSIVDSLRSASERLQDLTEKDDEAEAPDPHDTLKRLQARLGESSETEETANEESPGTVILQNQNRSMFDMMEDE